MTEVETSVREAIADHGPIAFDEYMEIALYGPGGFFERPPIGGDRHFVTAPHVHPFVFGHCIRDAVLETWHALGEPDPFRVVELGAGDGTLAQALLDAFAELPMPGVDYVGVDVSPGAREALASRGLANAERIEGLQVFEGAVIANELLDNLPFLPIRGRRGGPVEIRVGIDAGGRLVEVEVPWSREGLDVPSLADGHESTVPTGALAMLDAIHRHLREGSVLLIDFGGAGGAAGGVHGYRRQREVTDILAQPGATDITAGVDWPAIVTRARTLGLQAFGPVTQAEALRALGHARWEATMREVQSELLRARRGSEAARVWGTRSRASLLTDPSGLGGFRWLVLTTSGVPAPAWLGSVASD